MHLLIISVLFCNFLTFIFLRECFWGCGRMMPPHASLMLHRVMLRCVYVFFLFLSMQYETTGGRHRIILYLPPCMSYCLIAYVILHPYLAVRYDVEYLFARRRVACVLALQERGYNAFHLVSGKHLPMRNGCVVCHACRK